MAEVDDNQDNHPFSQDWDRWLARIKFEVWIKCISSGWGDYYLEIWANNYACSKRNNKYISSNNYQTDYALRSWQVFCLFYIHYSDVIMVTMGSQITSLTVVYSTVYSGADQIKYQSSASLYFVRGIHRWPLKWPVTPKIFPFDDVIMSLLFLHSAVGGWSRMLLPYSFPSFMHLCL